MNNINRRKTRYNLGLIGQVMNVVSWCERRFKFPQGKNMTILNVLRQAPISYELFKSIVNEEVLQNT